MDTVSGNYTTHQNENGEWFFHPSDNDWLAFNRCDSFSIGYATEEEAIEAAEEWEAVEG